MARPLALLTLALVAPAPALGGGTTLTVDPASVLARTSDRFASFSFDFTALFGVQRTAIPFTDARLRRLARNLAPAYVRFGGSYQDRAVTTFAGVPPPIAPPPTLLQLSLNESVFDGLVDFAAATGLDLVYGLNAAVGRQAADGSLAPWDAANALAPIARAVARGARVPVVELGNEVNVFNCSTDGLAKISAAELAAQFATAAAAVRALDPGIRVWGSDSSITGDAVGQCHDYYGDDVFGFNRDLFAQPGWAGLLDAHTWHYYAQDSRNATSTAALILSDEYQARLARFEGPIRALRDAAAPGLPLVLGETASFWAGGRANVSNRYASGFWYLPQLSTLAALGYAAHIRQDLAGGDYGLLECVLDAAGACVAFTPNADYFTHALFQRLVSEVVVSASVGSGGADATGIRAWAWCAAGFTGEVVIAVSNFNATAAPLTLAFAAVAGAGSAAPSALDLYALTAGDAALGLASATVRLNGALLTLSPNDALPPMLPLRINSSSDLTLPPSSYGFVVTSGLRAPLCMAPPDEGVTAA